jgi:uncharacterized protein YjiS (DUF1127 family)
MTTISGLLTTHRSLASSKPRRSLAASLLRLFVPAYRSWIREASLRQAIRELDQLDDHTLKDIGLQRGSIEAQLRAYARRQK